MVRNKNYTVVGHPHVGLDFAAWPCPRKGLGLGTYDVRFWYFLASRMVLLNAHSLPKAAGCEACGVPSGWGQHS